jgi:ABC-2 type transport system ATP-binding protein
MIQLTNLNFAYPRKGALFCGLNLHLPGENIYGLLGKNGAGKTTLLKMICGLLFPGAGDCQVLGFNSSKRDPELLKEIFFITEELTVPPLTIREYQALYAPFYPRFKALEFQSNLAEFSLSTQDKITRLSYGQKKKFLIAFGLATDSRILILDEPTNGLDIPSKSQFRKLLASNITPDRIFLISTHQVRDMQQLIDPVIILDNGRVIFQRSLTEVNEKLSVQLVKEEPDPEQTLFYEKVIGGYSVLRKDERGLGAGVDLEILFNAVIKNQEKINAVFEKQPVLPI